MNKREKIALITVVFAIFFSGCSLEYFQTWGYSGYKQADHKVEPDTAYIAKCGTKEAASLTKKWPMESWIKDSVPFFNGSFEKKHHELFLLLLSIVHQRKKENFGLDFSIYNDKNQIKSFDSIYYSISDSSTSEKKTGKFISGKNLVVKKGWTNPYSYLTSYSIDMHPKKSDIILADFELYYTDIHNKVKVILAKKIKFSYYSRRGHFYSAFD